MDSMVCMTVGARQATSMVRVLPDKESCKRRVSLLSLYDDDMGVVWLWKCNQMVWYTMCDAKI